MTLDDLRGYLEEMTVRAQQENASVEIICARMWKEFTPQALSLWTTSGVLMHIAQNLAEEEDES